eukprot:TRINITY_DN16010_c0_g1_i1.p1 TRINITY_DN16010_c0_g1~~TRINITY_DN16010_c0_g1_i1.p1  ORF type:complete len:443 (+),score=110.19 TRINITY_DN16010_c0_g1_i1:97-1425(+)
MKFHDEKHVFVQVFNSRQLPSEEAAWKLLTNVAERVQSYIPPKEDEVIVMFRAEDTTDWIVFAACFLFLVVFDNLVLNGNGEELMSFRRAVMYSIFWLFCAASFCGYVFFSRGGEAAFDWGTGYILEWMLSVDNLFVFRSIFLIFHTPNTHKHKPLLWGICGAIVFRMIFFVVGEVMMRFFKWTHFVLGIFLMYTGWKILGADEDDEGSPNENPAFLWIAKQIKLVDAYSPTPKFLEKVALDSKTQEPILPDWTPAVLPKDYDSESCGGDPSKGRDLIFRTHATRLVLVVLCLELTDILFAVDSVSAIIAQVPDMYLAYTACVFAMLGLRATFFAVDELVKLFTLLPYAVSAILIFIGAKLVMKHWIHIPPSVVCSILVGVLAISMLASVIFDRYSGEKEESEPEEEKSKKDESPVESNADLGTMVDLHAEDTDTVVPVRDE